ncbi:MAG: HU family DNA-binding protein [Jaaginema sp. PMC 1079.18]|nr:HU family DNA-binding protein [Jaaginema sp. PMC 1080.18]MEC4850100.1 HU family DNA-binding protein [Jaaginema sp. PMC 1079.18]MEC4864812.1 HU family DNA-binding protein [Jaaginema sp. PMC 1078.18]
MNKQQLVDTLWERTDKSIPKDKIYNLVTAIIQVISERVAAGDRVKLLGFGSFFAKKRKEREGRNPQTGEPCLIPAATVPQFSPGKEFKDLVDAIGD